MKKAAISLILLLAGCESVGHVGMLVQGGRDPRALLKSPTSYVELGPARGEACRFFVLGVFPFGDSDVARAADEALARIGGDALIDVTVSSSLIGFMPIYNVFCYTCTEVKGNAVRFVPTEGAQTPR